MHRKPSSKGKPVDLPVYGDAAHNMGVYHAIGVLVINWAIDESVCLAVLQTLLHGDKPSAVIAWYAHNSTAARLELVSALCRQRINDEILCSDVLRILTEFGGYTKVRNFFCHATYVPAKDGKLRAVEGVTLSQEGKPLRVTQRLLDRETLNDVTSTARKLADMNQALWGVVKRIEDALGVPPSRPPLPLP